MNDDFGHDPWSEPGLVFLPDDYHVRTHVFSKNGDIPSSVAHIEDHGTIFIFFM